MSERWKRDLDRWIEREEPDYDEQDERRSAALINELGNALEDLINLVDDAIDGGTLAASDFSANASVKAAREALAKARRP